MILCILGRQPKLGLAELERLYGAEKLHLLRDEAVLVDAPLATILERPLGGSMKIAEVLTTIETSDWQAASRAFVKLAQRQFPKSGKITLGLSAYGFKTAARDIQKTALVLKQKLKGRDGSLRLIPQTEPALNTAQVLHNKLGRDEHKKEVIFVLDSDGRTVIAETRHVQDIEAYAFRDQGRPKRDAFVGMLPPKLAQLMINLGAGAQKNTRLLDPFCGTGVILQEAALMDFAVYGTDKSEKMVRYSQENLRWLSNTHHIEPISQVEEADARTGQWQPPLDNVVCETYLGQPFSTEPRPEKLADVRHECNSITKAFLQNLAEQITPGTPLCIAVPAWHTNRGIFHLPLLDDLEKIGYNRIDFTHASQAELIYHRDDQIVGRELLVLTRS